MKLPAGFLASGIAAGVRSGKGPDLALLVAPDGADAAAVFTRNQIQAAPVTLSRNALRASRGRVRAVVINAGCANAVTGAPGEAAARKVRARAAEVVGCRETEVFLASTGVIGKLLPADKICDALPGSWARLSTGGLEAASQAILTTDAGPKLAEARFSVNGKPSRVVMFGKGAGMIHPNMATMLGFALTDAAVAPRFLKVALKRAVDASFNIITVDGDTSTNDTVLALASGAAAGPRIDGGAAGEAFVAALTSVCEKIAWLIVRDGEGATRVLDIHITGARTEREAGLAAHAIATSPLVKTALHGGDPNWGRVLAAVGRSGAKVSPTKVAMHLGKLALVKDGLPQRYTEKTAAQLFSKERVMLKVALGTGRAEARRLSSDLGHDYITCNADYRS
ncbi:MAG: bifunctional glutamate N-acetyltransferase/amino-acid acetyltransferase ArgJ [Polyangia bacterium]